MGEELKFQQRWDFRRGDSDFDSSSYDSKSSLGGEPAHKKHRLALIPVNNDEIDATTRFQQKGDNDPGISGQIVPGKAEEGKRGRSKNVNLAPNKKKRRTRKGAARKKGKTKTSVDEHAALDDLKNYMNSLLEELKVTRKNLVSWMKEEMAKLVEEEKASESERKEGSFRGEENQLKYQNNSEENARVQYQNLFGKNIQVQHQNNFEDYSQLHHQSKFEKNVQTQQIINLEENIELQPQKNCKEKVQVQRHNKIRTGTGGRSCNGGPSQRYSRNKKLADSNNTPVLEDQADYSRAIVLLTPTEGNGEDRLALPDKSISKFGPSDSNLQAQQQKSIVLGIRAQNCNGGSPVKSAKGKRAAKSNDHCQVPNDQVDFSQGIGFIAPTGKDKGERSRLYMEPNFSSNSFNQTASSMYLTLPTVLANPHIQNHRPDTSSINYFQPRIPQNQAGINAEKSDPILGSSSYLGYYQSMLQPEDRSRNYSQMSYSDISSFNQNGTTTSFVGHGVTVPLQAVSGGFNIPNQFDLESLPRKNSNTLGLSMNGGAIRFSGEGYSLPEPYIANNFHSHSNYRADGRLMTYQDSFRQPK
ncbi:hypothetical protein RCOM_1687010 [Ricinus communis]|uniref:Uncharacterized protein n=2 Tax=Ricinus communis TaxID=3988 RepID=B9RCC9_RICCO|nr:hypothetical protein RCOM_1687010 [Ricinus communis]